MAGVASVKNGKKGGRPPGSKTWKTIAKEKAREEYFSRVSTELDQLIFIHIEEAKKPKNFKEREYIINQTIGKPTDKIEHTGKDGAPLTAPGTDIAAIAAGVAEKLREQKT